MAPIKTAFFYLIDDEVLTNAPSSFSLSSIEFAACQQLIIEWQKQKLRILVACESKQQAEKIDEYLWQLDTATFIPHNLAGEGPKEGAPVELCWSEKRGNASRQILINLQTNCSDYMMMFNHIIDFVPQDENLKILARERYNQLKNMGFKIKTLPFDHLTHN